MNTNFYKTGHRGCRGLMPENTIISFIEAVKLGCNAIELDIVVSQDRQLVVSHEPYMNSKFCLTSDGKEIDNDKMFNLYKMPYEEIKKFDVGLKKHPDFDTQMNFKAFKPLLYDVVEEVERYTKKYGIASITYDIEVKSSLNEYDISQPSPEEIVDLLIPIIYMFKIQDRIIIRSFDVKPLQYLKNKYSEIKIALLVENDLTMETNLSILGFTPDFYSPNYKLITEDSIKFCKNNKMGIIPWTVNDLNIMESLIEQGVDGIITDYPNLFQFIKV